MGMFDKDKEIGAQLGTTFAQRENFILWGTEVEEKAVKTDLGMADKTTLTVSKMSDPNEKFEVGSLSGAISEKAKSSSPDDFPCVVFWTQVDSKNFPGTKAVVIQWVRDWDSGDGRGATPAPVPAGVADDDIPL